MHSGIVNGYQMLCDAHTVLEPHGEVKLVSFLLTIALFFFLCVRHSDSLISFRVCLYSLCVNNLKRTSDLVF